MESFIIQFKQQVLFRIDFLSVTSDCRVGLEVKIKGTPAGGVCATQGTFSSLNQ